MFRISQKYTKSIKFIRQIQTYYDVLKLNQNCTQKDIRNSFIKLSKKHHPDTASSSVGVNEENTRRFQQIIEAYEVLGKPHSRLSYDAELRMSNPISEATTYYNPRHSHVYQPYRSTAETERRADDEYYGLKGVKKVSNYVIVVLCLVFCGIGVALQFLAIRSSLTFKREKLDIQSTEAGRYHAQAKENATKYGNEIQLKHLKDKIAKD
ncbi:DnaJ-like protein 60 [Sergentomyia squamirostris]